MILSNFILFFGVLYGGVFLSFFLSSVRLMFCPLEKVELFLVKKGWKRSGESLAATDISFVQ